MTPFGDADQTLRMQKKIGRLLCVELALFAFFILKDNTSLVVWVALGFGLALYGCRLLQSRGVSRSED